MSNLSEQQFADYRSSHRAPGPGPDFPRNAMHDAEDVLPDYPHGDVRKATRWYGSPTYPQWSRESHQAITASRGNPEHPVTVYRATPTGEINPGDWVTPSRSYAEAHRESNGAPDWNIAHRTARAGELYSEGDMHEWGWHPRKD